MRLKRLFDVLLSLNLAILISPIIGIAAFFIYIQDLKSPFYISDRVGLKNKTFKMIKLRSMISGSDLTGIDSTSNSDSRITPVGKFIRKLKIDELTQLFNVVKGDMSLVGPRPNVKRETETYTLVEKKLLTVRPGITDFASIVFADEGKILEGQPDPDLSYNQLIRPIKSKLGIFYVENRNFAIDLTIMILTLTSVFSRSIALRLMCHYLRKLNAPKSLILQSSRQNRLVPMAPPGSDHIVMSRLNKANNQFQDRKNI